MGSGPDTTGIQDRQLEVVRLGAGVRVVADDHAIHFSAPGSDLSRDANWPRPLLPLGERFALRLPTLVRNGQAEVTSSGISLPYEQVRELGDEDAALFDVLCHWSPLSTELSAYSVLGAPNFRLRIRFLLVDIQVQPEVVVAFVKLRGTVYRLHLSAHRMLHLVEDLNAWPEERKANRSEVFSRWADIRALLGEAGAEIEDRYLLAENAIAPSSVHLDLHDHGGGRVSVVPSFDGVPESSLHREYLRFSTVQEVYDVPQPDGGRVR